MHGRTHTTEHDMKLVMALHQLSMHAHAHTHIHNELYGLSPLAVLHSLSLSLSLSHPHPHTPSPSLSSFPSLVTPSRRSLPLTLLSRLLLSYSSLTQVGTAVQAMTANGKAAHRQDQDRLPINWYCPECTRTKTSTLPLLCQVAAPRISQHDQGPPTVDTFSVSLHIALPCSCVCRSFHQSCWIE
jgi:hypothetical protein